MPWAWGLLSAFWKRGSPDMPACGPWHGSTSGPVRPIFINQHSRPSRGAKPHGADYTRPPQGQPHQAGSRGCGEIKARGTSRGAHDASHDDQDQVGARRAPAHAESLFPLWCQGGKRRRGVSRHQAKVSISLQREPGGRQRTQSPCFLFGAKGASAGAEYRGIKQRFPYHCNETKTSRTEGWRSPWSPRQRHCQCLW